jgi:deoxyribose-phosphate aldolase
MEKLNTILNQKTSVNSDLLLKLISVIDLTSLNSTDSNASIDELIMKANKGYLNTLPAAICVFSNFGEIVKKKISPKINVAVVSSCFPTGQTIQKVKLFEVESVNETQIDEIDIVISRGEFLAGNYDYVFNEISEIKKRIPHKHLKVILETGELVSEKNIRKASKLAIKAGADFIKTSTGKINIGSTPEAVFYMCDEILKHYKLTGKKVGIKPAGGIRNLDDALKLYKIIESTLGMEWLNPNLFRIGASSLYDNLINEHKTRFNS